MYNISNTEFERAKQFIPGGVSGHLRSFKAVNGNPVFVKHAAGSQITDVDQNQYIDYCLSGGTHILGHAPRKVLNAVESALREGTSFGLPTTGETDLAEILVKSVPSIEMVQLTNSGTKAVINSIHLARGYTQRTKIVKFDGSNHGRSESGNNAISLPFNNEVQLKEAFEKFGNDIAAIIVEPIPAKMGVILPNAGFLQLLRDITLQYKSLLIFDEIITGFRPGIGGVQEYMGITPDITTLGKIIGGGFPLGAYGGKKEIMAHITLEDDAYQSGMQVDNPIAITAGIKTLQQLSAPLFYKQLNQKAGNFIHYLSELTMRKGIIVNSFQSMFTLYFAEKEINNYSDAKQCDVNRFGVFYKKLLENGIFFSPSPFETNFVSSAHTPEDLSKTLEIVSKIVKTV